jgi:hypothetical protein
MGVIKAEFGCNKITTSMNLPNEKGSTSQYHQEVKYLDKIITVWMLKYGGLQYPIYNEIQHVLLLRCNASVISDFPLKKEESTQFFTRSDLRNQCVQYSFI